MKWQLGANGSAEVNKAERDALAKLDQVQRLRAAILSGAASPDWPAEWPDLADVEFRWFVLTHDVLPSLETCPDGVTLRSHQLLALTLPSGATVFDLIDSLDNPPLPPRSLTATYWERIEYGGLKVDVEVVA